MGTIEPPKEVTSRELLKFGRRVERLSVQRRKLLAKVAELDASIREAKRMFRQLSDLIMGTELPGVNVGELPGEER